MGDTFEMLVAQVEAQAEAVEAAGEWYEADEDERVDDGEYSADDFYEWMDENVLSVECTYKGSLGDEPELDSIDIVVCTGGPHVELHHNGASVASWVGYWSGSTARRSAGDFAQYMADYYWEIAEQR